MQGVDVLLQTECMTNVYPEGEKRTYTVGEIQNILGISQPTAYGLVRKNLFRTVRVGRHIRISKKSFDEWLDQTMGGAADE